MWERFSFYGMRAIFVPFMGAAVAEGGLAYTKGQSGAVLAMYMAMVYMMSLPGGWIADKYLGQRRAVFLGGIIIVIGHILLALPSILFFYLGLAALVLGTGFLKPNVSTMVGQLYDKKDPRIDAGFSIFYMGINVGAFASPIICGFLAQSERFKAFLAARGLDPASSWHYGFGAAAVGMALGLVIFHFATRTLAHVGAPPKITDPAERARNGRILNGILGAVFGGPALLAALHYSGMVALDQERLANIFGVVLLSLFLGTFFLLYRQAKTQRERQGVQAMFVLAIGCTAFFALFEQAAGTMNAFADERTHNVAFGKAFPSAWYQSINSVFIILLSPLFAAAFTTVAQRKLPFNDIRKFGVSLVFMGLAFLLMLPAVHGGGLVNPLYLVVFYFFSTVAELFLSPVGLSSMSKLAPASAGGLVMGTWFLSTSNGDYIAGRIHGLTGEVPLTTLFLVLPLAVFAVAALIFAAGWYFTHKVPLESLMRGAEAGESSIEPSQELLELAQKDSEGKEPPLAQVVKDKSAAPARADASSSVSGDAIAAFATAVAVWPLVLDDPKLGGIVVAILGTSSVVLALRGLRDAKAHGVGGVGFAKAAVPIALGAAAYAAFQIFTAAPLAPAAPAPATPTAAPTADAPQAPASADTPAPPSTTGAAEAPAAGSSSP